MRQKLAILLLVAVSPLLRETRAQDAGPIRHPADEMEPAPEIPQASCVEYWDLPVPLGWLHWREFPPSGLVEEIPQTSFGNGWRTGFEGWIGVQGPQFFKYDEAGRVAAWTSTSGVWTDPMRNRVKTTYAYDESANLVDISQQDWVQSAWRNSRRWIYTYDEAGIAQGAERHEWNRSEWEIRERVHCSYDDAGRLIERIGQNCVPTPVHDANPICQDTDSTLFTYDGAGRITLDYRRTREPNGDWQTPLPIKYTYDGAGKLVQKIDTGRRSQGRSVYGYDGDGRLTETTLFANFTKRRTRYAYQHAGALTRIAEDRWDFTHQAWAEDGEIRLEYNQRMMLEAVSRLQGGSEDWSREHYRYDYRDNLLEEIRYKWRGTDWVDVRGVAYTYDDAGALEEAQRTEDIESWGDPEERRQRIFYNYGIETEVSPEGTGPRYRMGLAQNHPNPFNRSTTIPFELSRSARVTLSVFDLMGRQVAVPVSGPRPAGRHQVTFEAADLPSGIYFYRLEADDVIQSRRMVVVK